MFSLHDLYLLETTSTVMYRYYKDYDSVIILVIEFMFNPFVSLTSVDNWVDPWGVESGH